MISKMSTTHRLYNIKNMRWVCTVGFLSVTMESLSLGLLLLDVPESFWAGASLIFLLRATAVVETEISISEKKRKVSRKDCLNPNLQVLESRHEHVQDLYVDVL